jgi:excinuclease ABC subunit A
MHHDHILVVGARENNLKNISVEIPRDRLVVVTGLSGSGKSSLAFDTIYAEGQRRYVESLSAYARQFLGQMDKPDVDHVEGLSPAISIDQKSSTKNPRSTVGTVTEIYDYLRILYARAGVPHCPSCGKKIERQSTDQIVDVLQRMPQGTKVQILAPVVRGRKGEYKKELQSIAQAGYARVRVDGVLYDLSEEIELDRYKNHTIDVVVDRVVIKEGLGRRLADSVETALKMGNGLVAISYQLEAESGDQWRDELFSEHYSCPDCGISLPELEPRMFSFNSPYGACPACGGLGTKNEFDPELMVSDESKPVAFGAILPLTYKDGRPKEWYPQVLQALGDAMGFDAYTPISDLTDGQKEAVFYGVPDRLIVHAKRGRYEREISTAWHGVVNIVEKQYRQTESEWVKQDLGQYLREKPCPDCHGQRLKPESLAVKVSDLNVSEVTELSVERAMNWFNSLPEHLSDRQIAIAERAVKEIQERLRFLNDVGLGYLTLNRNARTLAGGEAQRIRLATQIGSGLMGCLYILDEPSIGLHQRDNRKLIETLVRLRDLGNTVIVVEHDEETMQAADWLLELGPAAGEHGGKLVAQGTYKDFIKSDCITAEYLSGRRRIEIPETRRSPQSDPSKNGTASQGWIVVRGARGHNLKEVNAAFPKGLFTCVTGVSGSGKSTLVQDTLYPRLMNLVYGTRGVWEPHQSVEGIEDVDKVIDIDQSPIGRTPRSNPATYTGTFDMIRDLFSLTPDARSRGYKPGRFSFNVSGGRCEHCKGDGILKIEMVFLPDVYVPCEVCKGKRYNRETLEVRYKGKNISEVLEMTIDEACDFFEAIPKIERKLRTLQQVGLGYIRLGQPATTLSGGEAQRVKLATELSKRATGHTVYILDEPTTGLHFEDVKRLLAVLHQLVDQKNTVIVIEHNLDVIKTADWVIDMGPEGGEGGGQVLCSGPPEAIAQCADSHTGKFLKPLLAPRQIVKKNAAPKRAKVKAKR